MHCKSTIIALFLASLSLVSTQAPASTPTAAPFLDSATYKKVVNFMTGDKAKTSGAAYIATGGKLKGKMLPLSFYTAPEYFGNHVCKYGTDANGAPVDCNVTDDYVSPTVKPTGAGAELQIERTDTFSGLNIYDGACWQMAMALVGVKDKHSKVSSLADNIDLMLKQGHPTDATAPKFGSHRGMTVENGDGTLTFAYNTLALNAKTGYDQSQVYMFRMIPRTFVTPDPFVGTKDFAKYVKNGKTGPAPDYQPGAPTWTDWKPVTGENAWGFFLGPLQSQYLREVVGGGKKCVSFKSMAIQNALPILTAFSAMQSRIGAVYYLTEGALGNTGDKPAPFFKISVENNASLLAGLNIFRQILNDMVANKCATAAQVQSGLDKLNVLIDGGVNPIQNYTTEGLLTFFKKYAFDKTTGLFGSGGTSNSSIAWAPYTASDNEPQAVDVNTWGVSALGVPFVDISVGSFGSSFQMWEKVKRFGGFYVGTELHGVGYSDKDKNGATVDTQGNVVSSLRASAADGIISGEWTLGAINMLKVMIQQYSDLSTGTLFTPDQIKQIPGMITKMQADLDSMLKNMANVRSDTYPSAPAMAGHQPQGGAYNDLIKMDDRNQVAFLYASKRYFIPFGWYANPIPSTTSTAWALMVHHGFNAFSLGGSYKSQIKPTATA